METFVPSLAHSLARSLTHSLRQSRNPAGAGRATLDELRAGMGGAAIPRHRYRAELMFTNELLPS